MNEKQKVTIVINGKEYEVEMWLDEVEKVITAANRNLSPVTKKPIADVKELVSNVD